MALTRDNPRKFDVSNFSAITAGTAIFEGSAVGVVKTTGLAIGGTFNPALHRFAGFAKSKAAIGERVTLQPKGRIVLTVLGATDASTNAVVYASDDDTFNLTGSGMSVGRVAWHQGNAVCVVEFDAAADMDSGTVRDSGGAIIGFNGPERVYPITKPPGQPTRPLNIVAIGPSISNYGFWKVTDANKQGYPAISELGWMLQYFGPGLVQKKIGGAVASKTDDFGNFGWSGKRCDEITAELLVTWIPQLNTANYVPDVILLSGVLVNDLYLAGVVATTDQIKARLDNLIRTLNIHFPSAKIICATPHLRNDTAPNALATYIASFDYARSYTLSLENGINFAAVDLSGLSYASTRYMPLSLHTYGVTQGNLSAPTPDLGVHPNTTVCAINGRAYAGAASRLLPAISLQLPTFKSNNLTMSGTAALTGTGNSGTAPTGFTQASPLNGSTCVGSAANPGPWTVTLTAGAGTPAGSASVEVGLFTLRTNTTTILPLADTFVQMWSKVKIISGAENIAAIAGVLTVQGTGSAQGVHSIYNDQYAFPADYKNDDVIYLMTPDGVAAGGTPTNVYHDVTVRLFKPNAPVVLQILESGWRETETRIPITVGASPATYTNTSKRPQQCVFSGGTVSLIEISRNGVTFDATGVTAGVFMLQPNDRIRVTHTAAPTVAAAYPQ